MRRLNDSQFNSLTDTLSLEYTSVFVQHWDVCLHFISSAQLVPVIDTHLLSKTKNLFLNGRRQIKQSDSNKFLVQSLHWQTFPLFLTINIISILCFFFSLHFKIPFSKNAFAHGFVFVTFSRTERRPVLPSFCFIQIWVSNEIQHIKTESAGVRKRNARKRERRQLSNNMSGPR